jgi:hypothetical protein
VIFTRDIPRYRTPEFAVAVEVWRLWRRFGWPYAGGWAEQPARVVDYVEVIEEAVAMKAQEDKSLRGRR